MAITLTAEPSSITPSKNPVRFAFSTNNYISSAGVAAVNKFAVTGAVSAFETIRFVYGDQDFTITAVNSPSAATGYNMPTGDGGTTHKGTMLLYFLANYYLNRDFEITLVGNDFIFTAREVGTDYTIAGTDTFANGSWTVDTSGVDLSYNENFFIQVDVYVEETHLSGNYTRLFSRYLKPDADQTAEIDIADQLHGFIRNQIQPPSYNQTAYSNPTNNNKRYYITYNESYGSTPIPYAVTSSAVKRVVKGGVKRELWPSYSSNFRTLYLGLPTGGNAGKFFTTRNTKGRTVTTTQHEYLYFCPASAISNARLRARVYYSDGSNTTTTVASYSILGMGLTYILPAGFTQLGLGLLYPALTPVRYYVWIDNTSGIQKAETVCFEIQDATALDRFFLYENSIGAGWETLRTQGQAEYGVEVNKEELELMPGLTYSATDSDIVSSDSMYREGTEVFTGFKTKAQIIELIDFINSKYCFEIVGGKHVPVLIDKGSFSIHRDDNYAYGLKFVYRPAYNQVNAGFR